MNSDIRLSVGFWQHPKTKKLARRLGLEGVRSLQILWLWAAQNRPNGALSGMDCEDIEIAADWQGEDGVLLSTLRAIGFIDGDDGALCLHDWRVNNGWVAGSDARSDHSRLTRMAKTMPDEYRMLVDAGVKGISKDDYAELASVNERATVLRRIVNAALTDGQRCVEQNVNAALSPAPAPAPDPEEINTGGEGVICAPARVADSVPENRAEDTPAVPATPKRTDCPSKGHPQWRAFLSCWDVYPVQQRQEEAWREWMRLYENRTLAEPYVIRDAILLLSQEDSRWGRGKIPNMARWLNGKGWNDKPFCEPSAAVPVAPAGGGQTRAPTEHQRRQQESRNMAAALLAAREQERQQHMGGGHAGQTAIGDAAR